VLAMRVALGCRFRAVRRGSRYHETVAFDQVVRVVLKDLRDHPRNSAKTVSP
jgi:hypothetical protein